MKWKMKDPKEWRAKFALFPKNIFGIWVWFEWYDTTGWYYDYNKCRDDLIKSFRYPSIIK